MMIAASAGPNPKPVTILPEVQSDPAISGTQNHTAQVMLKHNSK
jgi:hypothetical protein